MEKEIEVININNFINCDGLYSETYLFKDRVLKGYKLDLGTNGGILKFETNTITLLENRDYLVIGFYIYFNYDLGKRCIGGLEICVNDSGMGYMEPTPIDEKWVENDITTLFRIIEKSHENNANISISGIVFLKIPVKYFIRNEKAVISIKAVNNNQETPWGYMLIPGDKIKSSDYGMIGFDLNYRDDWCTNKYKGIFPAIIKMPGAMRNLKIKHGGKEYKVYWGDIHCHTKYCDGRRTPDDAYIFAKNIAKLDFAAITTHDRVGKVFCDDSVWGKIQESAKRNYTPGNFVTIPAYEWTGHGGNGTDSFRSFGHYNVYYFDDNYRCFRIDQPGGKNVGDLWESLKKNNYKALTIPHHPAINWFRTDFDFFSSEYVTAIEIYSTWGSFEKYNGELPTRCKWNMYPGQDNLFKMAPMGFYVQDYIAKGYKVGFIGSSDSHNGHAGWDTGTRESFDSGNLPVGYRGGLCALMCEELTREGIYDALKNRRCYAVTGERLFLDFKLNNKIMGEEISVKKGYNDINIEIDIVGTGNIEEVDIVRNGNIIATYFPDGTKEFCTFYNKEELIDSNCYYYIKVFHQGGNLAWSSPVYISVI